MGCGNSVAEKSNNCARATCTYFQHTRQTHGYCCFACKHGQPHGPACEKRSSSKNIETNNEQVAQVGKPVPNTTIERKGKVNLSRSVQGIDWQPSLLFGPHHLGTDHKQLTGTETMHIETHKGKLYASFGKWMSPDFQAKNWGQMRCGIARLDAPDNKWVVDIQGKDAQRFATRITCLKSLTWRFDHEGNALNQPVNQLVALFGLGKHGNYIMFRKDSESKSDEQTETEIKHLCARATCSYLPHTTQQHGFCCFACQQGQPHGPACERNSGHVQTEASWDITQYADTTNFSGESSARAVLVHHDSVTGADRIVATQGNSGVISGVYDPSSANPGHVVWDANPEPVDLPSGQLPMRCLSMVEANGKLYLSSGSLILQRVDGPKPVWKVVLDVKKQGAPGDKLHEAVGGIRGMTAIHGDENGGDTQSILLCWNPNGQSKSWILCASPASSSAQSDGTVSLTMVEETSIHSLASTYLATQDLHYCLAAYNDMLPVTIGGTACHLIGFEVFVGASGSKMVPVDPGQRKRGGGYWAGGGFAVRSSATEYDVLEVGGRRTSAAQTNPVLTAVRCYCKSPFPAEAERNMVYFGGYDCNNSASEHTAWIYKGSLTPLP